MLALSVGSAQAVTRTWDGGGADDNWDTVNNWDNNALPANGDIIVFATAFTSGTSIDLNGNRQVSSLTISTATDFSLDNNVLTIGTGDITRSATTGTTTINSDIVLNAAAAWSISGDLIVNGVISGATTLAKTGTGTLTLGGSAANTYGLGTVVSAGTLLLNKSSGNAIAGDLTVGDTSGSDTVRLLQSNQIADTSDVTIGTAGVLDLNGNSDTVGSLTITAGSVTTGAGTLTLGGNVTGLSASDAATISGKLDLGAATRTFTIANGGATEDMVVSAVISSTGGGLTKAGPGTLSLTGANTYTGLTTVNAGVLRVSNSTALGATGAGNGTTVASGEVLELTGGIAVGDEALTLAGTGDSFGGALRNVSGDNSWAGAITLGGATRINSDSGTLTLDVAAGNAITGTSANLAFGGAGNVTVNDAIATTSGTLTKDGAGTLTLAGDNAYSGLTTVSAGVVNIQHANALGTTATGTTVSSGAALQIQGGITTAAEALTLNGTGAASDGALRNISGNNTYAGTITVATSTRINSDANTLTISGGINESAATLKTLTIGGPGNVTITGAITENGTVGSPDLALAKDGAGTLTLSGANTYLGGTTLSAGHLALGADNVLPNSGTFNFAGGTLDANSHTDTIGPLSLTADSTLNLGSDTGTHGSVTFASATWTAGTLTIDGWVGVHDTTGDDDHIFVTADPTASGILDHIQFTGHAFGATWLSGTGEIVPVPEPINVALGVFGAVFVLFGFGRRLYVRRTAAT